MSIAVFIPPAFSLASGISPCFDSWACSIRCHAVAVELYVCGEKKLFVVSVGCTVVVQFDVTMVVLSSSRNAQHWLLCCLVLVGVDLDV